jgi:SAM-dependent methyltransferase
MNGRSATCAFCHNALEPIMNFGEVALAGAFLKPSQFASERKYPLRLAFCRKCYAVQVPDVVDAEVLFRDYFYFSSAIGTLRRHFEEYAAEVSERFLRSSDAAVLEFGCNDGVLLRPLADRGIRKVIGVDPAANVLATIDDARLTLVNAYFDEPTAERIVAEHGQVDIVMANNVYAHIPNIQETTRAVRRVLNEDGVFVFEVHYLGKVLEEMQYDMIYHEHLYYYSLLSAIEHFTRHGMRVFDVKPIPIHGGSLRFYVAREDGRNGRTESDAVRLLRDEERAKGFHRYETFVRFSEKVAAHRAELLDLLRRVRAEGRSIAGYGASGRANTIIQYCGIDASHLNYIVDDAPAKQGYFTPGSHLEIRSRQVLETHERPDYLLVFAWSFFDEICKRNAAYLSSGGKMILPLPTLEVVSAPP